MNSLLKWRFSANNTALHTEVGERVGDRIRVRAQLGCALHGPYVDLPAGRGIARIILSGPGRGRVRVEVTAGPHQQVLASAMCNLLRGTSLELSFESAHALTQVEVRLFCRLAVSLEIAAVEIELERTLPDERLQPDRNVGFESRKTYADKIASGFFDRYLSGPNIMEVGYKGYDGGTVPIVPQAIGVDVGYAGYDGTSFPFADEMFDAIYSSHCFEHIAPWKEVLQDWYRILKPGGFLIIVVPHQLLFERKRYLPSYFNPDHKRYYTISSLIGEIEAAFEENTYRVRHLIENDKDFDYGPAPQEGSTGCYEIELVIEKIRRPYWVPDDGAVRAYPAVEFRTTLERTGPWAIDLDLSERHRCLIFGPYIGLAKARYQIEYHFEPLAHAEGAAAPSLVFDVARDSGRIAGEEYKGERAIAALREGIVTVAFENDVAGAYFEFRIFAGPDISAVKPRFRGCVLRYDRSLPHW